MVPSQDSLIGSAFVDTVHGEDNVGPATHMLSYTWKYKIGDIVDSLQHWSTDMVLDPKRLDIWMCWACVNQHRVQEMRQKGEVVPFEQFKEVFEGRVKSIGKNLGRLKSNSLCKVCICVSILIIALCQMTRFGGSLCFLASAPQGHCLDDALVCPSIS